MNADATPSRSSSCFDRTFLTDYLAGRVPLGEIENVARHLEACPACATVLHQLDDTLDPLVAELRRDFLAEPPDDAECRRAAVLVEALAPPADAAVTVDAAVVPLRQLGPYELLAPLGAGGMGTVFKARHVHLGKTVALKLLPERRLADSVARSRFRQEMKAVGQLNHPHIVQAYDAEVEGVPYLAMEYVEGIDLARLLAARGPLPVADACELARQAALGLQHAHEHGLVHRDIKPSNLMLNTRGIVQVLDLGLARLHADRPPEDSTVTAEGTLMGTPDYMAPEQLLDSHNVDIRADLYSLGCTLYQLLAGQPPFAGPQYGSLAQKRQGHLMETPPPLASRRPDVHSAVTDVVDCLLAKKPADRFDTPAKLAEALRPLAAGSRPVELVQTSVVVPPGGGETAPPQTPTAPQTLVIAARRRGRRAVVIALGLALAGGALGWLLWPGGEAPRVERLEVRHYREQETATLALPALGSPGSQPTREGDWVRIAARLNRPSYCYLIAFNSNGEEQPCYPYRGQEGKPPEALTELLYPLGKAYFALKDGVGLQAFVLLASRRPLPVYAEWRARLGTVPWRAASGAAAWRYDGRSFEPLTSGPRGKEEERPVPPAFEELCRYLKEHADVETMNAVVFPVQAK